MQSLVTDRFSAFVSFFLISFSTLLQLRKEEGRCVIEREREEKTVHVCSLDICLCKGVIDRCLIGFHFPVSLAGDDKGGGDDEVGSISGPVFLVNGEENRTGWIDKLHGIPFFLLS